ncbi:MAG: ligase-associated DNA damage response DEXH box helicase [Gracilimonas sp.]|uniref:ligase-associated DNA damage response DEXH box helicase n=1 Tax=Gracilimonas sp. TaxID=1974203 RepID=UPI001B10255F|nr:ligase-associated DNA damage response DEXH box helicase [Gracilimonas sp.]MBO6585705.1 ligase-associated DNA damage response DEXH box helicase [Gracilimonas sp.]MBO6616702.1 ligase-associated DNA damage response DEXH box helicase [Gracilimonas sp.]
MSKGKQIIEHWFEARGWNIFPFQQEVWNAFLNGKQGLLNAPTGSGKSFALFMPNLIKWIDEHPEQFRKKEKNGLKVLWITPLRALAKDIQIALQSSVDEMGIPWEIGRRTGDVSQSVKQKQNRKMPEVLITTPESVHILLAQKNCERHFKNLDTVIVDEWHELLGSKRGIQTELGLSRLKGLRPELQVWGISATIGNLDEAQDVLLGPNQKEAVIIKANVPEKIEAISVLPDEMENFPWYGHLGLKLLPKILPIIDESRSTLIFTNTRAQSEIWFQNLLEARPDLAGAIAIHHGSLDRKVRDWVEASLHEGILKAVVCTSSLDLGVDFSPVETVIQIGSPKGVARFMQRAGRSGHQPGSTSRIYFVPTHALELIEAAALKSAIHSDEMESRDPVLKPYDVLIQYLVTLAVSDGFYPDEIFTEVKDTFAYQTLTEREWNDILQFITVGGKSLSRYNEYSKVEIDEDGFYKVTSRKIARRHRMSIGTIASDAMLRVKYMSGRSLGAVEEWFIAQLNIGDTFWFAGRNLELIKMKDMTVYVRRAKGTSSKVPSYMGGRMSLSSNMTHILRKKMHQAVSGGYDDVELKKLEPLFEIQRDWSVLPDEDQFLIEKSFSREGCHVFFFPFEGRYVHEGMSALIAHRLSKMTPITFSIAMNDYGFELLSDQDIPIEAALENDLFSADNLVEDIMASINSAELAKRRFREICQIAGLVFQGFPGQSKTNKHLQMSSSLFFDVFMEHEPDHLLIQQAFDEVMSIQLDEVRLRKALKKISEQTIVFNLTERFTPYAFPIMVDRLREKLSSEKLTDRIKKMQLQLEKHVK